MKKVNYQLLALLFASLTLFSSCEIVGGIFKAGFWSGAILILVVVILLIVGIAKLGGGKK
ncbi:MAG: phosphatidate cytidylyltransferase [Chitinophagaceae bacterium]